MYYKITAKRWFQRTYGNTYHSCRVDKCTGEGRDYQVETLGYKPFRYGYGEHYLNTAAEIIGTTEQELRQDLMDNRQNYAIFVADVDRKKDL